MTAARIARRRALITVGCVFVGFVLFILATLHWGGYLLVTSDTLPPRADGAVVLQASIPSEDARIAGAVGLLRQGIVDKVLLSIPQTGYWGLSFPDIVRAYLKKQYGPEIAGHIELCVIGPGVDSTEDEAHAIMPCIQEHHWRSFIVVTSNFHGRRAGMIWRRTWKPVEPPIRIWIDGVADPLFQPDGWWRHRRYAKTWFSESVKLCWSSVAR